MKTIPSLESLFEDFHHPNPYINRQASLDMAVYWPDESIQRLIQNLDANNVDLRRKSVKALGLFGEKALLPISKTFLSTEDQTIRISSLKVLIRIFANSRFETLPDEIYEVIKLSIQNETPQVVLSLVSLLRQLEGLGLPFLLKLSRDKNILRAAATITALGEIKDPKAEICLKELVKDEAIDPILHASAIEALTNYTECSNLKA